MTAAPATTITVASYNIRKAIGTDRQRRPDRTMAVLGEIGADVVALQEADRRFGAKQAAVPFDLIAEHGAYHPVPYEVRAGGLGWHGNAILIRKGVRVLDHRPLILPTLEPRGAVLADVQIGNKALRVVGMHLDLSGLYRRRQARAIMDQIAELRPALPTVLMGDLNEWRNGQGCLRDFGERFRIAETGPSFHARQPIARLDRIMASREIELIAAGTHRSALSRIASDHLPIWARVCL